MDIRIKPKALSGKLTAIPSKSAAHRILILAALCDKPTKLIIGGSSQDIDATVNCLISMGAGIEKCEDGLWVEPIKLKEYPMLDCGESGSTFRFMLPVASAICQKAYFEGRGRLPDRPIGELKKALSAHGMDFSSDRLPFEISGRLSSGVYELPGNISSQYVTGLLMALPLLKEDSEIVLTSPLESKAYVDMTLTALELFNIKVDVAEGRYFIKGGQKFVSPGEIYVEGDWSNAAAMLAFGALGNGISVAGLDMNSAQGDKAILDLLNRFGANTGFADGFAYAKPGELKGCTVDINETPDLLPVLAAVAACAKGETRFINAQRLKLKESDRLITTADMLKSLGIKAEALDDELIVFGGEPNGGSVSGFGDHRLVMAAAVLSSRCKTDVMISGAQAINKSYPTFFDDIKKAGGSLDVITVR
ncbi:MAG: 3-phosphoshikimate 1-carboxyvinyltransferase [Clostridiales bacterium]|nr:3-phosphoshikimate 1-carboxyvinyltransferase [Clostridiales bacterium]